MEPKRRDVVGLYTNTIFKGFPISDSTQNYLRMAGTYGYWRLLVAALILLFCYFLKNEFGGAGSVAVSGAEGPRAERARVCRPQVGGFGEDAAAA